MNKYFIGAFAAAGLALASQANATTYTLNVDGCGGGGCGLSNYGTVDVTGNGTNLLTVTVNLAANVFFNQAGGAFESVAWDLVGSPAGVTIGGLPSTFTALPEPGSYFEPSLGTFNYAVDWLGPPTNNGSLGVQTLSFTVKGAGASLLTLGSTLDGSTPIFFSVDVASVVGNNVFTGNVGATGPGGVIPEPATWAMMLVGFGGMGALLRRRRQGLAATA